MSSATEPDGYLTSAEINELRSAEAVIDDLPEDPEPEAVLSALNKACAGISEDTEWLASQRAGCLDQASFVDAFFVAATDDEPCVDGTDTSDCFQDQLAVAADQGRAVIAAAKRISAIARKRGLTDACLRATDNDDRSLREFERLQAAIVARADPDNAASNVVNLRFKAAVTRWVEGLGSADEDEKTDYSPCERTAS